MQKLNVTNHQQILEHIARRVMQEHGFLPDFSPEALSQLQKIQNESYSAAFTAKDLRHMLWISIDNDDSRDLDQLTVAETLPDNYVKIFVAVADVDTLVIKGTPIDQHAQQNTTSVYTAGRIFPMIPETLSTNLTSLNYGEDRAALVVEMLIDQDGEITKPTIYPALVRNHAKLAYNAVAGWIDGKDSNSLAIDLAIADNLRVQNRVAQLLRAKRHLRGALELQTLETRPIFADCEIQDLQIDETNRAKQIIEDFMIAANDVTARFLEDNKIPSIRRVVRTPKRWARIIEIAEQYGSRLPADPDSKALADFLLKQKTADPLRFPDLSLVIIKLLGSGEYIVEKPDDVPAGHFGLAVKDYTHSTAPNRRFPDLITQRILKAVFEGTTAPYDMPQLMQLAKYCTLKEDDANKVERLVAKSAAAMLLSSKIGNQFDAICTGAAEKGTWVRIFQPPIEGRLLHGFQGIDVGNQLRVKLIHVDVFRGFIDFEAVR